MIASIVSGIFAAISALCALLTYLRLRKAERLNRTNQRQLLKQTLEVNKHRLENQPEVGFDYAPKPDFNIGLVINALSTKGLLGSKAMDAVLEVRDALLDVDKTIGETKTGLPPQTTKFRQRFPEIRDRAITVMDKALNALGDES